MIGGWRDPWFEKECSGEKERQPRTMIGGRRDRFRLSHANGVRA
jgi:hypothetical protein